MGCCGGRKVTAAGRKGAGLGPIPAAPSATLGGGRELFRQPPASASGPRAPQSGTAMQPAAPGLAKGRHLPERGRARALAIAAAREGGAGDRGTSHRR